MTQRRQDDHGVSRAVRRTWFFAGGFVTAVVLVTSVVIIWASISSTSLTQRADDVRETFDRTPSALSIEAPRASVQLSGTDGPEMSARVSRTWYIREPEIQRRWRGDELQLTLSCPIGGVPIWFAPRCGIDYVADVPEQVPTTVAVSSGELSASGLSGRVDLRADDGRITADRLSGQVYAELGAGTLVGDELSAREVVARTSDASVELRFAAPPENVDVTSDSGAVTVVLPRGESYRVVAESDRGGVTTGVDDDDASGRVIRVRSGGGDVEVVHTG
ncbi:hypothetical protein ACWIE7_07535 [Dietzia sp. NPDC055343]